MLLKQILSSTKALKKACEFSFIELIDALCRHSIFIIYD